jgi:hypothetical protein
VPTEYDLLLLLLLLSAILCCCGCWFVGVGVGVVVVVIVVVVVAIVCISLFLTFHPLTGPGPKLSIRHVFPKCSDDGARVYGGRTQVTLFGSGLGFGSAPGRLFHLLFFFFFSRWVWFFFFCCIF